MKATVEIDSLRVRACHGVVPQERRVGNLFEVSVRVVYPPALMAVESDDVRDTLDYSVLADIVKQVMAQPSSLLEHVAGRIHRELVARYPSIESGSISVTKVAPPIPAEMKAARFTLEF